MTINVQVLSIVILLIARITCNTELCGRGCAGCRFDNTCIICQKGYFLFRIDTKYRCSECPENCAVCKSRNYVTENVKCQRCKEGYYFNIKDNEIKCSECPSKCKTCKSFSYLPSHVQCETCLDGFYLHTQDNTDRCTCNDGYYLSDNKCEECPYGRWGQACTLSCIPCSECVSDECKRECVYRVGTALCGHPQSTCHHECSKGFIGQRRSDGSTTKTVPTTIGYQRTERIITQLTTTQRQRTVTHTTMILTDPPQTRTSHITTSIPEDATTLKAEVQINGSGSPVLYIIIAVLAGLVLTGVFVVVIVCVKWRKQTRRRNQEGSPHNTNKEAESHRISNIARENISSHANAINVAESDTGYVDMNTIDNVGTFNIAESDTGLVDMNTIDTIASINVVASNTGVVDMNASAYVNIVNKSAMTATDTSNTYEALSQYTNVREAENQYTAISGNESVYYSVPNCQE